MSRRLKWAVLPDYEGHEVSTSGLIRNIRSGEVMKTSVNQTGVRYVALRNTKLNKYENRSVATLVASTFCPGQDDNTNTVLHLDGDPENSSAVNLMWVTRWHAIAFHKEINDLEYIQRRFRVRETQSNRVYRTLADAGRATGCLPSAIAYSVRYNDNMAQDAHTNFVHRIQPGGLIFRSA